MKRRVLKRKIIKGTIQSIRLLKRQRDRHDWAWRLTQGKSIEQINHKYVPYFIMISNLGVTLEALRKVREIRHILTVSNQIEKYKSGHIVQVFRKVGQMDGWFNYTIYNNEDLAKEACENISAKIKLQCRYVYNKDMPI